MTLDRKLPVEPPVKALVGPHHIPHMLSDPHPSSTKEHVSSAHLFSHSGLEHLRNMATALIWHPPQYGQPPSYGTRHASVVFTTTSFASELA